MIPKTPSGYRISDPIRSEFIRLKDDLGLVFVRKSFAPIAPDRRIVHAYSPLPVVHNKPMKKGISCAVFMERNHHYKNFKNVYPSYNNQEENSLWD